MRRGIALLRLTSWFSSPLFLRETPAHAVRGLNMTSNAKLLLYVCALWYALNVAYNDANKTVLKIVRLPWTMAALQLGLGLAYVVPVWLLGLRAAPKLTLSNVRRCCRSR